MEKIKIPIIFADEKIQKSFEKLKNSKTEDKQLYKWIYQALEELEENNFAGVRIQKKLIPKEYIHKY